MPLDFAYCTMHVIHACATYVGPDRICLCAFFKIQCMYLNVTVYYYFDAVVESTGQA